MQQMKHRVIEKDSADALEDRINGLADEGYCLAPSYAVGPHADGTFYFVAVMKLADGPGYTGPR